jgi:hypothetical protein
LPCPCLCLSFCFCVCFSPSFPHPASAARERDAGVPRGSGGAGRDVGYIDRCLSSPLGRLLLLPVDRDIITFARVQTRHRGSTSCPVLATSSDRQKHETMSVTTTDNPVTTAVPRAVLQDYDVHLTGDHAPPPNPDRRPSQPASTAANPPGWDAEHRGVPPYRPINTQLDLAQRPLGGNPVGDVFVTTMFTGVFINTVSNHTGRGTCLSMSGRSLHGLGLLTMCLPEQTVRWLWTNTGGRINDKIFHYRVGGEI